MPDSSDLPGLTRQVAAALPVAPVALRLGGEASGLVIVDEVNGFATVGSGSLAPAKDNPQVTAMIQETARLARGFSGQGWPILAFLDTHVPGKPEPPYPPHCEAGTGEEDLVPELLWLGDDPNATLVRKDCINGFVGAIQPDGSNAVVDWVNAHKLQRLVIVGICTDICVMDFVLTLLSARNHDLMPTLKHISVHAGACATYDLSREAAEHLGLPETACHPQEITHHLGLYFMAARGAEIAGEVVLPP